MSRQRAGAGAPFMDQSNDRSLSPSYDGDVLLWDIDKTYLDTRFSSFRGLASIPFELAIDKDAIPGAVPLLRALRRGPGLQSALVPLYFISGSPVQLRRVIERKMTLDGVEYDGITFKDQLGLLLARRAGDIRRQVGYKLKALLAYRLALPASARWLLFGDDVEDDAEAFSLFGEVCAGLAPEELRARLAHHRTHPEDIRAIEGLLPTPGADPVAKIFIHLTRRSPPERFAGARLVASRSHLQTALVLAAMGRIRPEAIVRVTLDLRRRRIPESTVRDELADAEARLSVPSDLTALARST